MNAAELKNVSKTYNGFCLDNINMAIPQGSIVGLVGENGAGKSTIIKLILDLVNADNGTIEVFGKSVSEVKDNIGIVFDEPCFNEYLTLKDIEKVLSGLHRNWQKDTFLSYAEKFSLPLNKKFKEFSRGMKMKTMIASALSHKAKLLILDEPTSGLDPIVRDEILDVFNEYTRSADNTILISSHILSDLEKICDYITFIHSGKIVFSSEKDLLKENFGVVRVSEDDFEKIDKSAVKGFKKNNYFIEALVEKEKVKGGFAFENASIEDIILFMVRGEKL